MATTIDKLKQYFSKGKYPTQEQFWALIESFWHKGEKLPMSSVDGLNDALNSKLSDADRAQCDLLGLSNATADRSMIYQHSGVNARGLVKGYMYQFVDELMVVSHDPNVVIEGFDAADCLSFTEYCGMDGGAAPTRLTYVGDGWWQYFVSDADAHYTIQIGDTPVVISGEPTADESVIMIQPHGGWQRVDVQPHQEIPEVQVQADWIQTDIAAVDFIKNKPAIPVVPGVATDGSNGLMSAADKVKLEGLNNVANIEVDTNTIEINPAYLLANVDYNGTHDSVTLTCVEGGVFNQPCIVVAVKNSTESEVAVAIPSTFGGVPVVSAQSALSIGIAAGAVAEFNLLNTNSIIRVIIT